MPDRTQRLEPEVVNNAFEQDAHKTLIAQSCRFAARSFDQPFRSTIIDKINDAKSEKVCA
jgi:hypothetical protein